MAGLLLAARCPKSSFQTRTAFQIDFELIGCEFECQTLKQSKDGAQDRDSNSLCTTWYHPLRLCRDTISFVHQMRFPFIFRLTADFPIGQVVSHTRLTSGKSSIVLLRLIAGGLTANSRASQSMSDLESSTLSGTILAPPENPSFVPSSAVSVSSD